jgi:hypothetical protein
VINRLQNSKRLPATIPWKPAAITRKGENQFSVSGKTSKEVKNTILRIFCLMFSEFAGTKLIKNSSAYNVKEFVLLMLTSET